MVHLAQLLYLYNIKKVTKEELKKIISDSCSAEQAEDLQSWIMSADFQTELEKYIDEDLDELLQKDPETTQPELSHLLNAIRTKAMRHPIQSGREAKIYNYNKPSTLRPWIKIAAAVALILSFALTYRYLIVRTKKPQIVKLITKENPRGRKSTIFLKDGTTVYLNAESSITFPEKFSDTLRNIQLTGEAYFEVAHNADKPFVVHTQNLDVTVLGTTFNVNAYPEKPIAKVSLNTGKVMVSHTKAGLPNEKINLKPGESVSFDQYSLQFAQVTTFDHDLDLGWKDGILVFKNADLPTIIARCEHWYNVDFALQNKPYFPWHYTGEFQNQSLEDVLESLSFSQSFDYKIERDSIKIKFKPN